MELSPILAMIVLGCFIDRIRIGICRSYFYVGLYFTSRQRDVTHSFGILCCIDFFSIKALRRRKKHYHLSRREV